MPKAKREPEPEKSKVEIYSGRPQILCPMQPCVVRPQQLETEDEKATADDTASSPPITSDARDPAPSSARLSPSPQERECELAIEEGENGETEDGETA